MSSDTDRVLASIDETLDGYATWDGNSGDAMSWEANPSEPFDEEAWLEHGYISDEPDDTTAGDVQTITVGIDVMRGTVQGLDAFGRALQPHLDAMKNSIIAVGRAMTKMAEANHPQVARMTYGSDYRAHRIRCRLCNPVGNPKPLNVNGADYRRRRRSRRRKNRR